VPKDQNVSIPATDRRAVRRSADQLVTPKVCSSERRGRASIIELPA